MNKHVIVATIILVIVLGVAGGFLSLIYGGGSFDPTRTPIAKTEIPGAPVPPPANPAASNLNQAPVDLRDLVAEGYLIIMGETSPGGDNQQAGTQPAARKLTCQNCHFEGGRSNDTICLAGVAAVYPQAIREGSSYRLQTLPQKVQECFIRNLNRKPPAADSRQMQAILAYLTWISRDVPVGARPDWLGLSPLSVDRIDDRNGMKLFAEVCSRCHGPEGQGTGIAPALWGGNSFTSASSMNRQNMLASFVYRFMPFRQPSLTKEQASDAAAFVLSRPRPEPLLVGPAAPAPEAQPGLGLPIPPAMPPKPPTTAATNPQLEAAADRIKRSLASLPGEPSPTSEPPEGTSQSAPASKPGTRPME